MPLIPESTVSATEHAVASLYRSNPEREWQRSDRHRTEFAVTKRAIADHCPPPPAHILDCGGGPGQYSIYLAQQGYQVTLFDLSPELLMMAQEKATDSGVKFDRVEQGTAIDLSRFADNTFDAVLLMGPLYHLLDNNSRSRAMYEAYRVAKPGAPVFVAFICRYAGHRDAAAHYPENAYKNPELYETITKTGLLPPRNDGKVGFVAYFTHPSEIAPLCNQAGFVIKTLLGLEGVVSMHEDKINELDGEAWEYWLDVNYRIAHDPAILGAVEHILAVCTKPLWRSALKSIAEALYEKEISFKVVGGTALALRGFQVQVNDLDLEMTLDDAYRFQALFRDYIVDPLELRTSENWHSYIGRFEYKGVMVEVMAELYRRSGQRWVPSFNFTQTTVTLADISIPVLELEEEVMAYIRRGRLERAALALPRCNADRLVELFHESIQKGML